jgi:peptidoglycan/LPS O-acetylase OafA/YrhL
MISRNNNFDLLRLFASIQVLLLHGIEHLEVTYLKNLELILNFFPGVLIFFTISGFLIFGSLERSENLKIYFVNRVLRIYPALWVALIVTIILLFLCNEITIKDFFNSSILIWILTQMTFFQFWTPFLLSNWGVGTPNGSLWTIPIEIQFYILLPILLIYRKYFSLKYVLLFGIFVSVIFNILYSSNMELNNTIIYKLLGVSLFPYLYSFLFGCMIYVFWNRLKFFFIGKSLVWFIIFISYNYVLNIRPSYFPHDFEFVSNFLLSSLTISLAFTLPNLGKILKGYDISYGLYLYHMLIINTFISIGMKGSLMHLILLLFFTILISFFSWIFIEKRALLLKDIIIKYL